MSNISQKKKLPESMSQATNLKRFFCRSKFESQRKNHNVKNCEKMYQLAYLLKASLYQFKRVNKTFLLKNYFNSESSNLVFVVICQR